MAHQHPSVVVFQLDGTPHREPHLSRPVRRSLDGTDEDPFLPNGFMKATAAG
jgi:hypothetical protein